MALEFHNFWRGAHVPYHGESIISMLYAYIKQGNARGAGMHLHSYTFEQVIKHKRSTYERRIPGAWGKLPDGVDVLYYRRTFVFHTLTRTHTVKVRSLERSPLPPWRKESAYAYDSDHYMWSEMLDGLPWKSSALPICTDYPWPRPEFPNTQRISMRVQEFDTRGLQSYNDKYIGTGFIYNSRNNSIEIGKGADLADIYKRSHAHNIALHYDEITRNAVASQDDALRMIRKRHNEIKKRLIKPCRRVWDMACGKGGDLWKYVEHGATYIRASDVSQLSIEEAKNRWLESGDARCHVDFHVQSMSDPLDSDELFDLISIQFAFHYAWATQEMFQGVLNNIQRHLAPGGRVVLTFPDEDVMQNQVSRHMAINGWKDGPLFGNAYTFRWGYAVDDVEYRVNKQHLFEAMNRMNLTCTENENMLHYYNGDIRGLEELTSVYCVMEFSKPGYLPFHIPVLDTWNKIERYIPDRSVKIHNTLCYLFFHMRCAIYCRVENNQLVAFHPFANRNYENNWPKPLQFGHYRSKDDLLLYETKKAFLDAYAHMYRPEKTIEDEGKWWANGGLIGNVRGADVWGQSMFHELHEAVTRAAATMGDGEFFLNKRDRPLLRKDGLEPYACIWNGNPPSIYAATNKWVGRARGLQGRVEDDFAPLYSFYTDNRFFDRHMPILHEYEMEETDVKPWRERRKTVFFRGGATGNGVTKQTNPRLKLCSMVVRGLDARLTSLNPRHKFGDDGVICFINKSKFTAGKFNYVSMEKQQEYKGLIYVTGHSGASRLSQLLVSGSVVFIVESEKLPHPWIYYQLQPWKHYIPVRSDLSDLKNQINWFMNHNNECATMAYEAREHTFRALEDFRNRWVGAEEPLQSSTKRYYFFDGYPRQMVDQLQLDPVAEFSVTAKKFADRITELCVAPFTDGISPTRLFEAFGCVGGNTMSFASRFQRIDVCEMDPTRFEMLQHNMELYGKYEGGITHVHMHPGPFQQFMTRNAYDVAFLDPPWGGTNHLTRFEIDGMTMNDMVNMFLQRCKRVVIKLPTTYDCGEFQRSPVHQAILGRNKMLILVFENRKRKSTS